MKDTRLREKRDSDLYECYRKAVGRIRFATEMEAADWVRTRPAPQFYIAEKHAAYILAMMLNGKEPKMANRLAKRQFEDLMALLKEHRREGESMMSACARILEMPAPCFYVDSISAIRIIRREKRRRGLCV